MICPFCHRETERLERHHVAGRANAPRLTVAACADCHHRELTARQYDAGVRLSHMDPRDESDRAWALIHGLSELVVAPAASNDPAARVLERATLTAGRVLAALADHPIGPDPVAASAREGTRQARHPRPAVATPESYAASFAAIASTIGRAWDDELGRPLELPESEAVYATLPRRLGDTDGARVVHRDLNAILGRIGEAATNLPGVLDDLDRLEYEARVRLGLLGRVATAASDEEAARILDEAVS